MGHPQPPTPVFCDNSTAVGIANNTVKRQRSRAMEMRYFWVADQVENKHITVDYLPGWQILADYVSKHHYTKHHIAKRPLYVHTPTSPRYLRNNRHMAAVVQLMRRHMACKGVLSPWDAQSAQHRCAQMRAGARTAGRDPGRPMDVTGQAKYVRNLRAIPDITESPTCRIA